jgi:hypothetical protein
LAKKLALFLKTNVTMQILRKLAVFRVKNASFFAQFLAENIQKS